MYSDSDSTDSEEGIRYKTDCTRQEKPDGAIGPALPPHLLTKVEPNEVTGPELPSNLIRENHVIGPALPPHLQKNLEHNETINSQISPKIVIGPVLPPHLQIQHQQNNDDDEHDKKKIGPSLPPASKDNIIGPVLPPHLRPTVQSANSDDDDVYGPLPAGDASYSKAQIALEERALQLKMDQLGPAGEQAPSREEWMVELPEVKASALGLGNRQFRSKAGPDLSDRSSWTDTPQSKRKKEKTEEIDLKKEAELAKTRRRDQEQEKMLKKHKKNKESLLEQHQKKIKKEKKESGEPSERRPFSRDVDLQVNRFDEAQKKAILKKAQLLDDRFSKGQSKFL